MQPEGYFLTTVEVLHTLEIVCEEFREMLWDSSPTSTPALFYLEKKEEEDEMKKDVEACVGTRSLHYTVLSAKITLLKFTSEDRV